MDYLSDFFLNFKLAIAGLFGAVISARFHKDELVTRVDFFTFVISGVLIAHYLTALVVQYWEMKPETAGGIGFLLGAFGGSLIQAALRTIRSGELWALIRKRLGGD